MPSAINAQAQAIIDRLRAVDQTLPYRLNKKVIEGAFIAHLKALKQPPRLMHWIGGNKEALLYIFEECKNARGAARGAAWDAARGAAWDAVRDAAWGAAWGAAWDAARDAAWDAAWDAARGAAIVNTLQDHERYQEFCAIWLPLIKAFESGLFVYWVGETEIVAVPRPVFRFRENQLHGDGVPAVEFPNHERYYFWRGVQIPQDWGKVNSEHWSPQWLLETKNAEQRRVLIQGLGYERIKSTLPTTVIHQDRDMELVKIAKDVDVEPIVVLKVVCPSTAHPYVLRVPPTMTTCEQARRWTLHDEKNELQFLKET